LRAVRAMAVDSKPNVLQRTSLIGKWPSQRCPGLESRGLEAAQHPHQDSSSRVTPSRRSSGLIVSPWTMIENATTL
jgi:hypothetical protein